MDFRGVFQLAGEIAARPARTRRVNWVAPYRYTSQYIANW